MIRLPQPIAMVLVTTYGMDVFEVCVTHEDSVDHNVNGVVDQVVPQSGQLNSGHIAAEEL